MEHERSSWNGPFRTVWMLPSLAMHVCLRTRTLTSRQTASLSSLCTRIQRLGFLVLVYCALFSKFVSSWFPSHLLWMWLHHYLIILLTDMRWRVNRGKKKTYFSTQRCFEWKVINDIGNDAVTVSSSAANWHFCSYDFNNSKDLKINTRPVVELCS